MKHNFQLNYFYCENTNAIYRCGARSSHSCCGPYCRKGTCEKGISKVAKLVRIHLISLPDVCQLLKSGNRDYNARNRLQDTGKLALF